MNNQHNELRITDAEIKNAFESGPWAKQYPPILSVDQAAELVQVPKGTIYGWSSRNLLAGCSKRVGKHLRIFRDRFIKQIFNNGIGNEK